jgi:hypothetical protein
MAETTPQKELNTRLDILFGMMRTLYVITGSINHKKEYR